MSQNKEKNFKKRFGDRIIVTYLDRPLGPSEQRIQNEKISKAFAEALAGILGREPTQNELYGIEKVRLKKKKPFTPP